MQSVVLIDFVRRRKIELLAVGVYFVYISIWEEAGVSHALEVVCDFALLQLKRILMMIKLVDILFCLSMYGYCIVVQPPTLKHPTPPSHAHTHTIYCISHKNQYFR